MRNRSLFVMAIAMLLAALACGPLAGSTEEVFDEIEEELDSAADGGAETADAPPFEYQGLDYESYNSYAINVSMDFTPTEDTDTNITLDMRIAEQQEPRASEFVMDIAGSGAAEFLDTEGIESGRIALYLLEGIQYVEFSGGEEEPFCFGSPAEEGEETESPAADFIGEDGAFDLSDTEDIEFEVVDANVEINGVMTYHYRATGIQEEDFSDATVDVYVSQEDGSVRRMILQGTGTLDESLGEGNAVITYDLLSVGEPIEVEIPEYCVSS